MKTLKPFLIILAVLLWFEPRILHAQTLPADWAFPPSLDFWAFEDVSNWTSGTGAVPASFTNIIGFRNGNINDGYSLLVDSTNPAWLSFSLTDETVTNLILPAGSLTLWVGPADWASTSTNGSGPGGGAEGAQIFSVGQWITNASIGYWGLAFSSDGNNLVFSAQTNSDDGTAAIYLTAPISWNTNDWHFVGLTWTETNSAMYVDGQLVTNGLGVTVLPGPSVTNMYFGSDSNGFGQCRCFLDDIYTFGTNLAATDFANIYDSQNWEYYLSPYNSISYSEYQANSATQYGSNLAVSVIGISNNIASLLAVNTDPDILYEIQSKTNLSQPGWTSEGFIFGSEITNWSAANVPENGRPRLFLRLRSWQDSTGTGIPDWWWLQYFGQITNVNGNASAAGDGYSNLQKFQMGLNPTNYYNPNPPPGFFGAVVNNTNAALMWSPSPGPVTNYLVQRGILNTNTGNYIYTSFILSSNVTSFVDTGVITNDNAQLDVYKLEALYIGGNITGTDTWYVSYYAQQGSSGPPYGPPTPTNVWAYPDATGTNLFITWTAAQRAPTNYIIERGIFDPAADDYDYYPVGEASTNTNSYQIVGEFSNSTNWQNIYAVVAAYPNGILSQAFVSGINAGPATGPAAPTGLYGYMDSTGTNAYLTWNFSSNAVGYIIYHGVWNSFIGPEFYGFNVGGYSYMEVAVVGAATNSFEVIGANDTAGDYSGDAYTVVAVYSGGALSQGANPWLVSTGSAAPGSFYAYLDKTGTNVLLAWSTNNPGATGYNLSRSGDGGISYSPIAQLSSTASTYKDTNGVAAGDSGAASLMYQIQVSYPHGGLSVPIVTNVASTSPAPTGLTVNVDSTGTNIVLSWQPALGASGYTIEQGTYNALTGDYTYSVIGTVGAGITSFTDFGALVGGNDTNNVFGVLADDTDGDESDLDISYLNSTSSQTSGNLNIALIHGPSQMELVLFSVPNGTAALLVNLVTNDECGWDGGTNVSFEIPISSFTNGFYVLSDSEYPYYTAYHVNVQAVASNGIVGAQQTIESDCEKTIRYPFLNGGKTLKDNLIFTFQGQTAIPYPPPATNDLNNGQNPDYPTFLWSTEGIGLGMRDPYQFPVPVYGVASFHTELTPGTAPPYLSGLYNYSPAPDLSFLPAGRGLHPWEIGTALLNWQYQGPAALCSLYTNITFYDEVGYVTGGGTFRTTAGPQAFDGANFITSQTTNSCPSILAAALGRGILTGDPQFPVITNASGTAAHVISGIQNAYGLPFDGVYLSYYDYGSQQQITNYFAAGADCPTNADTSFFWERYDPPILQKEFYLFSQSTNFLGLKPDTVGTNGGIAVTNLLIASVGDPNFSVSAWLRYHLLNGSAGVYGYAEQYFDYADIVTNGSITTTSTGILSPYGNFFATQPGLAALITKTNIEDGQRGTGIVHVISLNVDANHDGTMDFTFNGPDFVSTNKPFRFWVDDSLDIGDFGGDGIPGLVTNNNTTVQVGGQHVITGRRDLVNCFPVYLNIGSLFQSTPGGPAINFNDTNYQFVLSQADGALRFIYTQLRPDNYMNFLKIKNQVLVAGPISTETITSNGVVIANDLFLQTQIESNEGIILVQAWTNTTQPLVLTVYHGTNQIGQAQLPLSITEVEQMYRQKTILLNPDSRAQADRLSDADVPNEPENNGKNFVFVHGYNVNPSGARGNFADTFKRLYWSGSHAKFYGVCWEGYDSQEDFSSIPFVTMTPDYHENVENAFRTAPLFNNFVNSLSGATIVAAHSLGNMVVLSALNDHTNLNISTYFMLDAAVALEAIDGGAQPNFNMTLSTWVNPENYASRLYASYWWTQFTNTDARSTLTWSNRLGNFRNAQVYNFYSSGEEVLREGDADPPLSSFGTELLLLNYWISHPPVSSYAWVWQEKAKGVAPLDTILGSTHGGWKFNTNAPYYYVTNGTLTHMPNSAASVLPASQLQTNAFFDTSYDYLLFNPLTGSAYAQLNGNRILSDAIPAMTFPVGANPVPRLQAADRNIDMMTLENGWPDGRFDTGEKNNNWYHSDFHQVAYTFTYHLFDQLVSIGNLK